MYTGLIIMGVAFAIFYIMGQIIPLFRFLSSFDKEDIKDAELEDFLFVPLMVFVMLIPFVGILVCKMFQYEESKWERRIALISTYILIIGFVITLCNLPVF